MIQDKPILHGRDHMPDGPDPIPGLPNPFGDDVEDIILALPGLAAFWKLNEASGTVAADSSGNLHDLDPLGGYSPPTWAQEVAPTGATSALFVDDDNGLNHNANVAMSAFLNNFSAGIWVSLSTDAGGGGQELIGQGHANHAPPSGWQIQVVTGKAAISANGVTSYGNSDLDLDTWYFLSLVRDAGTWKLYVNGLVQAATQTTSLGSGSTDTWIANDAFAGHTSYLHSGLLSYGFMVDSVLSSTDMLAIYEAGAAGGAIAEGLVWTTDGSGGASWQQPTIEVDY